MGLNCDNASGGILNVISRSFATQHEWQSDHQVKREKILFSQPINRSLKITLSPLLWIENQSEFYGGVKRRFEMDTRNLANSLPPSSEQSTFLSPPSQSDDDRDAFSLPFSLDGDPPISSAMATVTKIICSNIMRIIPILCRKIRRRQGVPSQGAQNWEEIEEAEAEGEAVCLVIH